MSKPLTADDILPLVACLTPRERLRLLRLMSIGPEAYESEAYRILPPARDEFTTDDEPLSWDAEGWGDIG